MTEFNGAMMQYFHWYSPADGSLWKQLSKEAENLAKAGITSLWLPPAYKGAHGKNGVGYAVYDMYDLGEFDQKGSIRTKYGTREEYLQAIRDAQKAGLRIYADIVFNHRIGGDHIEEFKATPYNPNNRNQALGEEETIQSYTHFDFPGRKGKHSSMRWHWWHFNASDYNHLNPKKKAVYLFEGKQFHHNVDLEKGNFDYLMGCNLDMSNEEVKSELIRWGEWFFDTTQVDGFRFDAAKHVMSDFFVEWLNHIREHANKELFAVGEYWSPNNEALKSFLERTGGSKMLFDVVLHYNFSKASKAENNFDLTKLFEGSLVEQHPDLAVTLVSNHDSQPLQALESVVEQWFKPLAYASILLRKHGYPCVFAADYYGADYKDKGRDGNEYEIHLASHKWMIDHFLYARRNYAFGDQHDYIDHPNCIGWIRTGNKDHPGGIAVVLTNAGDTSKHMQTFSPNTEYHDITQHCSHTITTDGEGRAEFCCKGKSVSVWIPKD